MPRRDRAVKVHAPQSGNDRTTACGKSLIAAPNLKIGDEVTCAGCLRILADGETATVVGVTRDDRHPWKNRYHLSKGARA